MIRAKELCKKEVIRVYDGKAIGYISDFTIDLCGASVVSLTVSGEQNLFTKRGEDVTVPWGCVRTIGKDAVLVDLPVPPSDGKTCSCEKESRKRKFPFKL